MALDGELGLARGNGVRILALATDGHLVGHGQRANSTRLISRLTACGVVVLHLDLGGMGFPLDGGARHVALANGNDALSAIAAEAQAALRR